jgi:hypothetical protein
MGPLDIILGFVAYALAYAIGLNYKQRIRDPYLAKYFLQGLHLKIIGALATGVIYYYYYESGDTVYYFRRATYLSDLYIEDPVMAFRTLFGGRESNDPALNFHLTAIGARDSAAAFVVRIASFFALFFLKSYFATAVGFAVLSYTGVWALFKTWYKIFPTLGRPLAIACIFVPSTVFWGSGIFKDTVTYACLCWIFAVVYQIIERGKPSPTRIIILLVCVNIIGVIKSYILMVYIPSLFFLLFLRFQHRIKSKAIRNLLGPIVIAVSIGLGSLTLQVLASQFQKFSIENIETKAEGMQRWHTQVEEKIDEGSHYSLGDVSFTPVGLITKFPQAVNVTLFRPYIWEAGNPVMFLAFLEASAFLYFSIILIFIRPIWAYRKITANPYITFALVFSLIFAFGVGFTSYNFGALVRYKIPCLSFYAMVLAYLYGIRKGLIKG